MGNCQFRSIYIVGAQGTGKTTLVDTLSRHVQLHFPEISLGVIRDAPRVILADREFSGDHITDDPEEGMSWQERVLEAQLHQHQKLDSKQMLISARAGIDLIVCAADSEPKDGMQALFDSVAWKELRARMMDSLVVVCEPVRGRLEDDEVRLLPMDHADWVKFHGLFCSQLAVAGLKYVKLPRDVSAPAARLQFVLDGRCLRLFKQYDGISAIANIAGAPDLHLDNFELRPGKKEGT